MKNTLTIILLTFTYSTFSQTILLDENFTSGIPTDWTTIDADGFTPGVSDFTDAWIGYTTIFDTCAASTSYYIDENGDEDTVVTSDYLITPKISLLTFGNLLTWDAKSLDGSFPDGYEVLISTTDNLEASFTTVLKTVNSETPYWTSYSINLMTAGVGYADQDVYIAFKNTTTNGYILQLDNIKITGDDPASINQKELDISIYPNPVANVVSIDVDGFEKATFYNLQGQLVLESYLNKINVSILPKGIYIVHVKTAKGVLQKKIVKT